MLSDDIKSMDSLMSGYARLPIFDVWQRIKKESAEALKPSHNIQSKQCQCGESLDNHICPTGLFRFKEVCA